MAASPQSGSHMYLPFIWFFHVFTTMNCRKWRFCVLSVPVKNIQWKRFRVYNKLFHRKFYYALLMAHSVLWEFEEIRFELFNSPNKIHLKSEATPILQLSYQLQRLLQIRIEFVGTNFFWRTVTNSQQLKSIFSVIHWILFNMAEKNEVNSVIMHFSVIKNSENEKIAEHF